MINIWKLILAFLALGLNYKKLSVKIQLILFGAKVLLKKTKQNKKRSLSITDCVSSGLTEPLTVISVFRVLISPNRTQ